MGATVTTLFIVPIFYTYLRTKPPVDRKGSSHGRKEPKGALKIWNQRHGTWLYPCNE